VDAVTPNSIVMDFEHGTVSGGTYGSSIRRWILSTADLSTIQPSQPWTGTCFAHGILSGTVLADNNLPSKRITSRWKWLVTAQRVLATVMATPMTEEDKDALLSTFQSAQFEAQESVAGMDSHLATSLTGVAERFCLSTEPSKSEVVFSGDIVTKSFDSASPNAIISPDTDLCALAPPDIRGPAFQSEVSRAERVLYTEVRRCAAWEAEVVGDRWRRGVQRLERALRDRLKRILQDSVNASQMSEHEMEIAQHGLAEM